MRTYTFASGDGLQFLEQFDLFLVISDLKIPVIDDDRPFQDRRIFDDEIAEFIDRHRFDIDTIFLNDLGTLRDDIIRTILSSGDQILDLFLVEQRIENILLDKLEVVIFKIILDFPA